MIQQYHKENNDETTQLPKQCQNTLGLINAAHMPFMRQIADCAHTKRSCDDSEHNRYLLLPGAHMPEAVFVEGRLWGGMGCMSIYTHVRRLSACLSITQSVCRVRCDSRRHASHDGSRDAMTAGRRFRPLKETGKVKETGRG